VQSFTSPWPPVSLFLTTAEAGGYTRNRWFLKEEIAALSGRRSAVFGLPSTVFR
jgi:hypothetical protein